MTAQGNPPFLRPKSPGGQWLKFTYQCKGKILHAPEQLSPCTATIELAYPGAYAL